MLRSLSRLLLLLAFSARTLLSAEIETPVEAIAKPKEAPLFVLVGDSTVTVSSGWGHGFAALLKPEVVCVNTAQGGRSSKSFRDEGHWDKALALKGRIYLIQFGHNDQPGKGPKRETDPATTFRENMARYAAEVQAIGGQPILLTSLTRRIFDPQHPGKILTTLTPYANATLAVAQQAGIPVIDLHALSLQWCERLGPDATAAYNFPDKSGKNDTTHLQPAGSLVFARLVIKDLVRLRPELKDCFLPAAFE